MHTQRQQRRNNTLDSEARASPFLVRRVGRRSDEEEHHHHHRDPVPQREGLPQGCEYCELPTTSPPSSRSNERNFDFFSLFSSFVRVSMLRLQGNPRSRTEEEWRHPWTKIPLVIHVPLHSSSFPSFIPTGSNVLGFLSIDNYI